MSSVTRLKSAQFQPATEPLGAALAAAGVTPQTYRGTWSKPVPDGFRLRQAQKRRYGKQLAGRGR